MPIRVSSFGGGWLAIEVSSIPQWGDRRHRRECPHFLNQLFLKLEERFILLLLSLVFQELLDFLSLSWRYLHRHFHRRFDCRRLAGSGRYPISHEVVDLLLLPSLNFEAIEVPVHLLAALRELSEVSDAEIPQPLSCLFRVNTASRPLHHFDIGVYVNLLCRYCPASRDR